MSYWGHLRDGDTIVAFFDDESVVMTAVEWEFLKKRAWPLDAATTTSAGSDGGSRVETDATALGADVVVVAPSDEED